MLRFRGDRLPPWVVPAAVPGYAPRMATTTPPDHEPALHRQLLPAFLFDTDQPKLLYILKAWLLAFIPSIGLAGLVTWLAPEPPAPDFGGTGPGVAFAVVIFAPVVETLLMTPPVLILNRLLGPSAAILGSAILWGFLHSWAEPLWGLIIWWPFLVLSAVLLAWREKGLGIAMAMVIAVHAMQNLIPGMTLLLG